MIASASLWAPVTTAQMSIGLATLSRVARACRAVSPRAIRTTMALAAMKGSTEETCSQNTMSCMFSPPSRLAPHWTMVMIGPYTLGVSYQGCSDPLHHRVELAADHLADRDVVRVAADDVQPSVARRRSTRRPR